MSRPSGRKRNELREVIIEPNVNKYAEGSCLISCGNTKVLCTASIEEKVENLIKKPINDLGYELYDVIYTKEGQLDI